MKIFVFLGPTLSSEDARSELEATYLPPAGQGDVLRAAQERPYAIAIIDGYFERVPAVWHKEILWALSQRIHVCGAASMGALRAAELASFGMRGFGRIFSAFHSGTLEDDDEVAVAHGDASTGFRASSTALVNIRATLQQALERGLMDESQLARLLALAKRTFYPDRSYRRLLAQAEAAGILGAGSAALRDFVTTHALDQKRSDAIELLRALRELQRHGTEATPAAFHFAHTEAWDRVLHEAADSAHARQSATS
jgi:hypothetical protein